MTEIIAWLHYGLIEADGYSGDRSPAAKMEIQRAAIQRCSAAGDLGYRL